MQNDTDFFRRRACQEREAAAKAVDVRVRRRHLEFLAAYELLLREIEVQERRSALRLVEAA